MIIYLLYNIGLIYSNIYFVLLGGKVVLKSLKMITYNDVVMVKRFINYQLKDNYF